MDLELKGKVAIVGGASKGLGRACAQVLAEEGASVAICSRSQPDLEKAAQEIRDATGARRRSRSPATSIGTRRSAELIAATVERFGRLDVLVNNSGGPPLAQRARRHRGAVGDRGAALAAVLRAHVARGAAAPEAQRAAGASSTSSRAPSTSRSRTSRSPARRAWAWWRSRRASPTRSAATASSSTTCARARSCPSACCRTSPRARRSSASRWRRRSKSARRETAVGPHRRAEGAGVPRRVPRLQPVELHHRHDDAGRRRAGALGALGPVGPGDERAAKPAGGAAVAVSSARSRQVAETPSGACTTR